jgi:hypothetical protein
MEETATTERTTKTIWAAGKRGTPVGIEVDTYPDGIIRVGAEADLITDGQLLKALVAEHPGRAWRIWEDKLGYRCAESRAQHD